MGDKCNICEEISFSDIHTTNPRKLTKTGKWIIGVFGISFTGICAVTIPFLLPAARKVCLPFVPATSKQVKNVLGVLARNNGNVIDLGSGDGRIVIEAAKYGKNAVGVELNPWLVWYARCKAWMEGVHCNTTFYRQDIFKVDFKTYDNIVIFGVDSMMEALENSIENSVSSDCNVIACRFPFPSWTPVKIVGEGIDKVWLYKPSLTCSNS